MPPFLDLEDYEFLDYIPHIVMNLRLGFRSIEQAEEYDDCTYALVTAEIVENVHGCLKAINMVGRVLWSENVDSRFLENKVSRRDYLNFTVDAFLARIVSVNEILLYLLNHICETKLTRRQCNLVNIRRAGIPERIEVAYNALHEIQEKLRAERNDRFHLGLERSLSSDDQMYRIASDLEVAGIKTNFQDGDQKIDIDKIFRDAVVETQNLFAETLKEIAPVLRQLFLSLWEYFDTNLQKKKSRQTKLLPWYPA